MDYKGVLPEKNSNVSHNHPLKEFMVLVTGVAAILLVCFWVLGLFIDIAVDYLPPDKEGMLFSEANFELGKEGMVDPKQYEIIQEMVDSLRGCMGVGYPVQVSVVQSKDLNAFAIPGGVIVVFSSVLDKIKSENGLSFILAHELAHFKNRDHLRSLGRGVVLAALSSMLTGADSNLSRFLAPTFNLGQAQFSQGRESKADIAALEALNCRYGHVGGASEFFEIIQRSDQEVQLGTLHYFASHPELAKRIESLRKTAEERGLQFADVKKISL